MICGECVEILTRAVATLLCVLFVVSEENHARLIQVVIERCPAMTVSAYIVIFVTDWMDEWLTDFPTG
jgi:hypothetical protein